MPHLITKAGSFQQIDVNLVSGTNSKSVTTIKIGKNILRPLHFDGYFLYLLLEETHSDLSFRSEMDIGNETSDEENMYHSFDLIKYDLKQNTYRVITRDLPFCSLPRVVKDDGSLFYLNCGEFYLVDKNQDLAVETSILGVDDVDSQQNLLIRDYTSVGIFSLPDYRFVTRSQFYDNIRKISRFVFNHHVLMICYFTDPITIFFTDYSFLPIKVVNVTSEIYFTDYSPIPVEARRSSEYFTANKIESIKIQKDQILVFGSQNFILHYRNNQIISSPYSGTSNSKLSINQTYDLELLVPNPFIYSRVGYDPIEIAEAIKFYRTIDSLSRQQNINLQLVVFDEYMDRELNFDRELRSRLICYLKQTPIRDADGNVFVLIGDIKIVTRDDLIFFLEK